MPRCFCGEELEDTQHDMCGACRTVVDDTVADFEPPEGVAGSLANPIPIAGIVMPLEKAPRPDEDG